MLEIIGQARVTEAILFFVLVFVLPMTAMILHKLRRYEAEYGPLAKRKTKGKKKEEAQAAPGPGRPSVPDDVFPYQKSVFLDPSERMCLIALEEALGEDACIYAKVALAALLKSTDANPGFGERLREYVVDFLICDAVTKQPFSAIAFEPDKSAPARLREMLEKTCAAAELHLVFLPRSDEYDKGMLKELLGIPDTTLDV